MFKKENKEIKITREEFLKIFMEVIANPFNDKDDLSEQDKAQMQFSIMMTGMLLMKNMDERLFGEQE